MSKGRLPSFRGPRDLSLGAKSDGTSRGSKTPGLSKFMLPTDSDKKKKFTPNLNVTRKEVKPASESATAKSASGWDKSAKNTNQRHSKHSKPDLIQTSGTVFADGIGNDSGKRKSGWGSSREASDYESPSALERPKVNLNASFNKVEEEEKLKKLLRDDFIDDLKTGHLVPVQLPMINTGKVFENEAKLENVDKKKKKKIPELDSDDDEEEEVKPAAASSATPSSDKKDTTLMDLIDKKMSELLFFQMPDHFPGSSGDPSSKDANQVLESLSDGYLGKLQVTKSGKVQLWMNNLLFDVDIGTQVGFLQELFSIENNEDAQDQGGKGSMTNLGRVRNRVVVMPAWNDLLHAANVNQDESAEESSSDSD